MDRFNVLIQCVQSTAMAGKWQGKAAWYALNDDSCEKKLNKQLDQNRSCTRGKLQQHRCGKAMASLQKVGFHCFAEYSRHISTLGMVRALTPRYSSNPVHVGSFLHFFWIPMCCWSPTLNNTFGCSCSVSGDIKIVFHHFEGWHRYIFVKNCSFLPVISHIYIYIYIFNYIYILLHIFHNKTIYKCHTTPHVSFIFHSFKPAISELRSSATRRGTTEVQSTLVTLGRAIKGFVVMSAQLEDGEFGPWVMARYIWSIMAYHWD